MQRIQQLTHDVGVIQKEIEKDFELVNIDSYLSNINYFIQSDAFIINIIFLTNVSSHYIEKISNILFGHLSFEFENIVNSKNQDEISINHEKQNFLYKIYFLGGIPPKKMEDQPAFMSVCIYDPNLLEEDTLPLLLDRFIGNSPLVISLSTEDSIKHFPLKHNIEKSLQSNFTNEAFNTALRNLLTDNAYEILKRNSLLEYLSFVIQFLKSSIEQESNEIEAKDFILKQQISRLQANNNVNPSQLEWLQNLKVQINKYFMDYEKGVRTKIEDNVRPQTGQLWNELESRVNDLDKLDKVDKAKMTEVRISKEFENNFLGTIYQILYINFANDLKSLSDLYKEVSNKIEDEMTQVGINVLPYNFSHLSDISIKKIIDSTVRIDKPYKNETPRKGAYEYFMAVRRYQIVFIMLFSTFGVALASFKQYMIPITIVLLAIGGYFVWKSVTEERADTANKELERAKESLKMEYKRILSESQREWISVLNEHQKEQLTQLIGSLEKQTRDFYSKKNLMQTEQRQLINRQLKGVDSKQKLIQNAYRNLDVVNKAMLQYKAEINTNLSNVLTRFNLS